VLDASESRWRPLITDPDRRAEISTVITEVVAEIEAWRRGHEASCEETADYATLRIYAATDDIVPDPGDDAGRAIEAAIAATGELSRPALYGGMARVAFAVAHLSSGEDTDVACDAIERSLLGFLELPTERYDLIGGLVGIAVPALQRIADGNPSASSEPIVRAVLDHLERLSRPMATGIAWHTPPSLLPEPQRRVAPDGYINLGLAHGVPGVVAILARCIAAGIDVGRARGLLDAAVEFLRSVAGPRPGTRYPAWLPTAPAEPRSRVAWCYGDLGIAVALMSAAGVSGRVDWRNDALDLARGMAARSYESSQVSDAALCHGAAGVAHLFNRLAQATDDAELAAAADTWFGHTLAMRRDDAIAGFPRAALGPDSATIFEPAADLLSGASGVALALHAAISQVEPSWDRLLLADLSPIGVRGVTRLGACAVAPEDASGPGRQPIGLPCRSRWRR